MDDKNTAFFLPNFCSGKPLLILIVAVEIMAIVLSFFGQSVLNPNFERLGLVSLFMQWVAISSAACLCSCRTLLAQLPMRVAVLACFVVIMSTTALFSYLSILLDNWMHDRFWRQFTSSAWDFLLHNVLIAMLMGVVCLRYFYVQQQWRLQIKSEATARLSALQARIEPHFLFNSLNTIASLTRLDPKLAEQLIEDLAELFRANLKHDGAVVNFAEEVALSKKYLNIESLRLGGRLRINWDVGDVPKTCKIPLLTLQPLLENAIYYGISQHKNGGTVIIKGKKQQQMIELDIVNAYSEQAQQKAGHGIALDNIRARLRTFYGDVAELTISQTQLMFSVKIRFPYEEQA